MNLPLPSTATAEPHVFLIGRPPITEFLGFVTTRMVGGADADQGALMAQWRAANDHIKQLEVDEAGLADGVEIGPLPDELKEAAERVASDPSVQRTYALTPFQIGMVDLDRLCVHQKNLHLAHAERLAASLPDTPTPSELFDFALPLDRRYDPPVDVVQIAGNAWSVTSPSNDLRLLDMRVLDPARVDQELGGAPATVVAVAVGYGANMLSAVRINGRIILANGSHRAYALYARGHRSVPFLVQDLSRREELEIVGLGPVTAEPDDPYLTGTRPPLLKDYFDANLRLELDAAPRRRTVQVQVGASQIDT